MSFQAHKGVSPENPENTISAFAATMRQGGKAAESDIAFNAGGRNDAASAETSAELKHEFYRGTLADMHTHSESSHDSVCRAEDMLLAQTGRGTDIFAVTDHFDTASFEDYDVFTPIKAAAENVAALNRKYGGKYTVLTGIEISEGFWYPQVCEKALGLTDYDVVIGSVHLVKYKDLTYAYSKIDFSSLKYETVAEYMEAYFDDVLTMTDEVDFDILAHLTCPLRYITGKYGINLDMSRYEEKIDTILRTIIKKGIALEVNTSSYDTLDAFMPDTDILKRYYALDGYLITLGSDAHVADNASKAFDKAVEALKKIGFENVFGYKKREPFRITI